MVHVALRFTHALKNSSDVSDADVRHQTDIRQKFLKNIFCTKANINIKPTTTTVTMATRLLATPRLSQRSFSSSVKEKANIAVIGAGWWSQGWHIPHLHRNPGAHLTAIVDSAQHPKSSLNPNLEPLSVLFEKYGAATFSSVSELLRDPLVGPTLDGVIVATPHATHYAVGEEILRASQKLQAEGKSPIHILMEKRKSNCRLCLVYVLLEMERLRLPDSFD
jgi:hypothetical protein